MAREEQTKRRRTVRTGEDGAADARYKKAKTADKDAQKKEPAQKRAASKPAAKRESPYKPASAPGQAAKAASSRSTAARAKAASKTQAASPKRGRYVESGNIKEETRPAPRESRQQKRDAKEKRRQQAMQRDRARAISRAADMCVTLIALLTAVFEALGLLLAMAHGGEAMALCFLIVPVGLIASLLMPRALPVDPLIMALTNFLCGVGIVVLCTVSPARGVRQAELYMLGMVGMVIISEIVLHMRRFHALALLSMVLGILALVLPLAFGEWQNGAKNWVEVPFFGSFQPSEIVKLSLVLSLAYYFSTHRTVWQMMPALLFAAACLGLLMLQRDLGTALIYYLTTLALFYVACGNMPLTLIGALGGAGAAVLGYKMFAHVKVRVAMWRNPWSDPLDKGYQIIQALLAIGSGGLFGVGLGQGTPEKIPMYYNDFIYAVICEQMGLVFGLLVLVVYLLLIARGVTLITRSRRSFEMLLGCGVVVMLGVQTVMIVGGVIKMLPLTGVTMPFLSYGGSSLVSCMALVGVLHGVGARSRDNMEEDILFSKPAREA